MSESQSVGLLQYVDLVGGFFLAAATHIIALIELFKDTDHAKPPDAIILTALVFISFGLVFTSIISGIGIFQDKDSDTVSKELLGQSLSYHRRLAGLLLFVTALYAGTSLEPADPLFDGEWSYGEGLFLGALIYKSLDSVVDAAVELFGGSKDGDAKVIGGDDPRVKDKKHHDWAALSTLGLSLMLFLVYQAEDDVFKGYDVDAKGKWIAQFKNTSLTEEDGKAHKSLINVAMILSIIAISAALLSVSFVRENRTLAAVGTISSALAHTVAGLLAVQVGQFLNVQAYNTEDTSFLPSNFFYFGASLLAFFSAKHFDSKDRIEEEEDKSDKQKGGFAASIGALVGAISIWAVSVLYKNVDYTGDINDSPGFEKHYRNITGVNGTITKELVPAEGDVASVAREIAMYATIIIAYIALHRFGTKIVEVGVKAVGGFTGLCKDMKTNDSQLFETGRSDLSIIFALATAVLFGSVVVQGDAAALADKERVSLWMLWILAVAARVISFFGVLLDLELGNDGGLFWAPGTKRIFEEDEGGSRKFTVKCLGAVIAIITSLIFFGVYVFNKEHLFGDATETTTWDGVLEGLAYFLVVVHVLLTLAGIFLPPMTSEGGSKKTYIHAGAIPILRFAVSSVVIFTLAISVGKNVLVGGTAQYAFWAFVLYLTYDILSKGKW